MRGPQFQIWLLYSGIIDTDVCVIFSSIFDTSFSFRDYKLTTFDTDLWEMVQVQKLKMKKYHAGYREQNATHAAIE